MSQPPPASASVTSEAPAPHLTLRRSLAPDLARGFMLLAIALAHVPVFISDWDLGPSALNEGAAFAKILLIDNQARNMFVVLFGYALGQMAVREATRGRDWPSFRKLLRRRGFWLLVIGFVNGALLVPLDIVSMYGLALLILAGMVRARGKVLLWTGLATLVPAVAMLISQAVLMLEADGTGQVVMPMRDTLSAHLVFGVQMWIFRTPVAAIAVVPLMALGIWAARRRLLDEPERHQVLLRRVAVWGIACSLVTRLPFTLLLADLWTTDIAGLPIATSIVHTLGGYAGGLGLTAVVALVAIRIERSERGPGPLAVATAALGQRSLTFYVFQSVVFLVLFYPFALDLHDAIGFAASFAVAVAIWAVSLLLAEWMRRVGHRGPLEALVRRMINRA